MGYIDHAQKETRPGAVHVCMYVACMHVRGMDVWESR